MVPAPTTSRKSQFRAALALAEQTASDWCAEQGITTGHLYQVLSGSRESVSLTEKVDAFIAEYLTRVA